MFFRDYQNVRGRFRVDIFEGKSVLVFVDLLSGDFAGNDAAEQAISAFAGDASKPSISRTYAQKLVHRKDNVDLKQQTQALGSSETSLRQKRRERLKVISDEALIDLDDYTMMLTAKRK